MTDGPFPDGINAEVIRPSALQDMIRSEIDSQIATAHRFPRSIGAFFKRAESLATATPEIAASCEYAKPVGGGKVKGPSARLAEIVAATYGNLRVQARVVSETETEVVAQGVAHDLETNVAHSTEVTVSLLTRNGGRVGPDQVATMRGAACSKARRNAIFLAVPIALCQPVIAAARKVAAGDAKSLPERRALCLEWFMARGVKLDAILIWVGVKAVEDIGLEEMADLVAAQNSAKDEGISLAELFGKPREDQGSLQEKMKGDMGTKKEEPAPATAASKKPPIKGAVEAPSAITSEAIIAAYRRAADATSVDQANGILDKHCAQGTTAEKVPSGVRAAVLQALNDLAGV
jgi:hypothetical protein